ncbi:hypothetical protein FB45DRAFT_1055321 [Roridomyces roridus]|uniref:Uncharacterized protein n=1 Tax=Roridomyces roridus TaxID=1738132 RepID=A0AAD7C566_9AGAR|nr:hypothetical protein FB45DRAFT_1055321 [Roridomyces roridus]
MPSKNSSSSQATSLATSPPTAQQLALDERRERLMAQKSELMKKMQAAVKAAGSDSVKIKAARTAFHVEQVAFHDNLTDEDYEALAITQEQLDSMEKAIDAMKLPHWL